MCRRWLLEGAPIDGAADEQRLAVIAKCHNGVQLWRVQLLSVVLLMMLRLLVAVLIVVTTGECQTDVVHSPLYLRRWIAGDFACQWHTCYITEAQWSTVTLLGLHRKHWPTVQIGIC